MVFCLWGFFGLCFVFFSIIVYGDVPRSYVYEYFLYTGEQTCGQSLCLEECIFLNRLVCTSEVFTSDVWVFFVSGYQIFEVQLVLRQALQNVWTQPLGDKKVR